MKIYYIAFVILCILNAQSAFSSPTEGKGEIEAIVSQVTNQVPIPPTPIPTSDTLNNKEKPSEVPDDTIKDQTDAANQQETAEVKDNVTPAPTEEPAIPTTLSPDVTTTVDPDNTTTTTTVTPDTTSTTTASTSTTTTTTTTTTTVAPDTTTVTPSPVPTTTVEPTPTPQPHDRSQFSVTAFIGGMVFAFGMMAIGFIAFKFYKARNERNYHTL